MILRSDFVSKEGLKLFIALNLLGSSAYLNNFPTFAVTETELGKSDHYTVLACYLFSIVFIVFRGTINFAPQGLFVILLIPHLFLLINGYFLELLQFVVFSTGVMFIAQHSLTRIRIGTIIAAYVIIILLFEMLLNDSKFMLTTFYGRPRLLLGFFHPKEAAIAVFAAYVFITLELNRTLNYLLFILTFILLFIIDSRNILLAFLVYNFGRAVIHAIRSPKFVFTGFCLVIICSVVALSIFASDMIDEISSSRLSMWSSLKPSIIGPSPGSEIFRQISQISAIRIDSFYLDFLMANGWIPFLTLIISLVLVGFKISSHSVKNDSVPISIFMSLCTFAINDSGMFSTGNLLNFLFWVLIINRIIGKPDGTYTI